MRQGRISRRLVLDHMIQRVLINLDTNKSFSDLKWLHNFFLGTALFLKYLYYFNVITQSIKRKKVKQTSSRYEGNNEMLNEQEPFLWVEKKSVSKEN